ncbi:1-phosphofructokinase family hexose kinase [Propionibacteriaceae bacterium Y1685]
MITVAGISPSLDITYRVDDFQLGEIHRPTDVLRCAGGKSLNMARAARRIGAEVHLVGIFGGGTGAWLVEALKADGISVDAVDVPTETRTCVSIASASSGVMTEVYENAPTFDEATWSALVGELGRDLANRPGWLSISGSAPSGLPDTALADLVRLGADAGVKVAVDTHSAALPAAVAAHPALVKVNRSEAATLLGVPTDGDLVAMAQQVHADSDALVVLTDGADGAVATDGTTAVRATLEQVRGSYPVGSGDSFLGGLVTELDRGADLPTALATAMACGTANALEPGPALFDTERVRELAAAVRITQA